MYITAAAALIGALLVSRTKPKTACKKKVMLGPRSGVTWQVEDFEDAGFIVVRGPGDEVGVFSRARGRPGFVWHHGRGRPEVLKAMHDDLIPPAATPATPAEKTTAKTNGQHKGAPS